MRSWEERLEHGLSVKEISRTKAEEKSQGNSRIAGLENTVSIPENDRSTQNN